MADGYGVLTKKTKRGGGYSALASYKSPKAPAKSSSDTSLSGDEMAKKAEFQKRYDKLKTSKQRAVMRDYIDRIAGDKNHPENKIAKEMQKTTRKGFWDNVNDFTSASNEAFLGEGAKGLYRLTGNKKRADQLDTAMKNTRSYDEKSTAAKAGRITGKGQTIATDLATLALPGAGAEKLVKGSKLAVTALSGGSKAAKVATKVAAGTAGSAASTGAGVVQDFAKGNEKDIKKNAITGTLIDLALPIVGKAKNVAKVARQTKSAAKQSTNIVNGFKSGDDFARAYSEALDARRVGDKLTKTQQDVIAVVESHRLNVTGGMTSDATGAFGELGKGNKAILNSAFDTRSKVDKTLSSLIDKTGIGKIKTSKVGQAIRTAAFEKNSRLYDSIDATDASRAEKELIKKEIDYNLGNTARGVNSKLLNDTKTHQDFVAGLNERSLLKNGPSKRKLYEDVSDYVKARHELHLMEVGAKPTNDAVAQQAQSVIARYDPQQQALLEGKYTQLKAASQERLDLMYQKGLLKKEKYDELKNNPDYIRVQRELDPEAPDAFAKQGGQASISQHQLIQKTGKSQADMVDPIASYLDFNNRVGSAMDRNAAAGSILPSLEKMGIGKQVSPERSKQLDEWYGESAKHAENVASTMIEGVAHKYELPKSVAEVVKSQQRVTLNEVEKILAMPTNFFKLLTTGINASFGSRNIVRDPQAASIFSGNQGQFVKNFGKSVAESLGESIGIKGSPELQKYLTSEGEATFLDLTKNADKSAKKVVTSQAREMASGDVKGKVRVIGSNYFKTPVAGLRTLANMSEQTTRYAGYKTAYEDALSKGFSEDAAHREGILAARNNSIDFYKGGQYSKQMNIFMPYLNPAIQGSRKFTKQMHDSPASFLGTITTQFGAPVAVATAWNMQNEETKAIYADIPEAEKDRNLIFVIPGMNTFGDKEYSVVKIPLAPGFSDFVQPIRRTIEAGYQVSPLKAEEVFGDLLSPFSPFGNSKPNQIASQTLTGYPPTKAILEPIINKNLYYNQDIVQGDMKEAPVNEQVYSTTSGTARQLGAMLGISPLKVEHAIRGVLGGGAAPVLNTLDNAQKVAGMKNPDGSNFTVGGRDIGKDISRGFTSAKGGEVNQQFWNVASKVKDLKSYREKQIYKAKDSGEYKKMQRIAEEYNSELDKRFENYIEQYGPYMDDQHMEMFDNLKINVVIGKSGVPYIKR